MENIFIDILNMSINASYFALAVIILRVVLRKAPKWVNCLLWSLVGLRLIMPFSFESILSLIPSKEPVPTDITISPTPHISSGIPSLNSTVNPIIQDSFAPEAAQSANPMQIFMFTASLIWIVGIIIMIAYAIFTFLRIRRNTLVKLETGKGIFICDNIPSPFILGLINPKIYLPSDTTEENKQYILAHEKAHIKRLDHIWKPLGFILLTVNWFNPVLWVAYILLCSDIESACDEKVIKELGTEIKKPYSEALINCSVPKKFITACPLAFGETGVKARIKNILKYKKPAVIIIVISITLCIIAAVCFLTDPKDENTGIIPGSIIIHTDLEGAYISLESVEEHPDGSKIFNCLWHNETDEQITYGEMYDIEYKDKNEWRSVKEKDIIFHLLAYLLEPYSIQEKSYSSEFFDISKSGTYRLICDFSADNRRDLYTWIEFTIGETVSSVGGADGPLNVIKKQQLTLDDVFSLAQKGDALSWTDFEKYAYTETGSGLYIRRYEIDEMFTFSIGGTLPEEKPWYFYLMANDGSDALIDIREADIKSFVNAHKDNPIVKNIGWGYYTCPVDNSGDNFSNMISFGGASKYMHFSSIRALPAVKINNLNELNNFRNAFSSSMDFTMSASDAPSFDSICREFTDDFFIENALLLLYVSSDSSSYRYTLKNVAVSSLGILSVSVYEQIPKNSQEQRAGWLLCIRVDKIDLKNINEIDARITEAYLEEQPGSRVYVFRDSSEEVIKPNFTLFSDGQFSFNFSAISSYFAVGHYTIEGNELVMKTYDGKNTYCFDIVGNTMIFNAEKSSDELWFSDITDGSVFY